MTTIHHYYRFGYPTVIAGIIGIILLVVFLRWSKIAYAVLNFSIIIWFGILDGFLDHTVKVFSRYVLKSEVAVTVLAPFEGNFIYETTGVLSFVASAFAFYYLYKLLFTDTNRVDKLN